MSILGFIMVHLKIGDPKKTSLSLLVNDSPNKCGYLGVELARSQTHSLPNQTLSFKISQFNCQMWIRTDLFAFCRKGGTTFGNRQPAMEPPQDLTLMLEFAPIAPWQKKNGLPAQSSASVTLQLWPNISFD